MDCVYAVCCIPPTVVGAPVLQSTLMRAIANGQLDGFPPKDELRTVYVEHDIDASEAETPVVEYVYADPLLQGVWFPCSPILHCLLPLLLLLLSGFWICGLPAQLCVARLCTASAVDAVPLPLPPCPGEEFLP